MKVEKISPITPMKKMLLRSAKFKFLIDSILLKSSPELNFLGISFNEISNHFLNKPTSINCSILKNKNYNYLQELID